MSLLGEAFPQLWHPLRRQEHLHVVVPVATVADYHQVGGLRKKCNFSQFERPQV